MVLLKLLNTNSAWAIIDSNFIHQSPHSMARQTLGSKISYIGTWCHCCHWYHLLLHLLLKPQNLHWKMAHSSNSSSHQYLPSCRIVNQKLNRDILFEDKFQTSLHVNGITASAHSSIYLSLRTAECNETLRPRRWIQKYPINCETSTWSWLPRAMVPCPVRVTIGQKLHPLIILELLQVEKQTKLRPSKQIAHQMLQDLPSTWGRSSHTTC